jgi:hypothetical protein
LCLVGEAVYQEVQHSLGTVVLVSSLTGSLMLILGLFLGYLLSSRLARYNSFFYCKPFCLLILFYMDIFMSSE